MYGYLPPIYTAQNSLLVVIVKPDYLSDHILLYYTKFLETVYYCVQNDHAQTAVM